MPAPVIDFTAGEEFTCAKLENNEIWCWGENGQGQLNDGTTEDRPNPVKSLLSADQIAISGGHSSILGSTFSQLDVWSHASSEMVENVINPLSISANRWLSSGCAVSVDGTVRCWDNQMLPEKVEHTGIALEVGTGLDHSCTINTDLTVSCWGDNLSGELGNGSNLDSTSAVMVNSLVNVKDLAVGANHTCVLQGPSQAALCWGENTFGQLGVNSTQDSNIPLWVYPPIID